MVQAFLSLWPQLLRWPGAGYRWWMYLSLIALIPVTVRRIMAFRRLRPPEQGPWS